MVILLKILFFIPFSIMFPTKWHNKKNLKKGKGIIVCNHLSNVDPVIIGANNAFKMYFLAKKELSKNKFCKWFFAKCNLIFIDRNKMEISSYKKCIKVLENNKTLTIFPEGTRNKTDMPLLELKSGAGIFACKTECKITPVWIEKKPKMFRCTHIFVGEGFFIEKEQLKNADEIIEQNLIKCYNMAKNARQK